MPTEKLQAGSLKKYPPGNTGLQAVECLMILDERFIIFEVFCDFILNRLIGGENAVCIEQSEFIAKQRRRDAADFIQDDCAACKIPWVQPVKQRRTARAACNVYKFKGCGAE